MNLPGDKKQDELRLRAAAERQIDNAPRDEPLARPAEELLHELQVHQVELEMQNEALRQAQIALEESRDRYVDLYEFAPVGYLTLGAEGLIEEINLTGATLLGRERKKLLQRRFTSLVIAEDKDRCIRHFLDVKQGDGQGKVELALQRGDGTVFPAQLDCVLQKAGAGGTAMRIALTDITEREQAEESLRASMALLDAVVDGTTDAIYAKDLNSRYTLFNKAAASFIGRTAEEVLGKDDYFLFPADEAKNVVENDQSIIQGRSAVTCEETLTLADGKLGYFLSTKGPIFDAGGHKTGLFGITRDITKRKRAEEELFNMAAGLENTINARTRELRTLSAQLTLTEERERQMLAQELHDNLGQLLAAIKIKLHLLKADSLQMSVAQIVELVDEADRSTRTITRQLSPTILRELGLMPALEWLAEEMQSAYGLSVRIDHEGWSTSPEPIPVALKAVLYRSLRELLINVAKHAKASEASLSCLRNSDRLMFVVSDDGCGFDPANFLGVLPQKSGFGLRSVRERMLNLGGDMDIDSSTGKGSTITLNLPHAIASNERPPS